MDKLKLATTVAYIALILGIFPLGTAESYRIITATYMAISGVLLAVLGTKLWLKRRN